MAAFFLELFSEEIPARMQARAAADLERLVMDALAALSPGNARVFAGPRRIALALDVKDGTAAQASSERGPRVGAPEQALAGFLRKHGAAREDLREEGGFLVLHRTGEAVGAAALVAEAMPGLLRRFPWPKAMRWGGTSAFTWVRPLRRILCLLDGTVVPFDLAVAGDDGHGLRSGAETEGHRVHGAGAVAVAVSDVGEWERALAARHVVVRADKRRALIVDGLAALAASRGLSIVANAGLVDEVAGLVEWPVPLLGRIDAAFMDLPAEVMQVSMRVNQRYFATRDADGRPAAWFAFAANVAAADGGAAIVAGNERVLRARFSDARHFWDLDRRVPLASRVAALDGVVFHKDLGTQGARVARIVALAGVLGPLVGADEGLARRAALLAKADLTTGMVGEFPELQGVMGGYYAAHDGEDARVADAVRGHYGPKGSGDVVPSEPVGVAVALADKLDQLAGFFVKGHAPTGSGDPFALRRAALGILRIVQESQLRFDIQDVLGYALSPYGEFLDRTQSELMNFLHERLRVQMKATGVRADIIIAAYSAKRTTSRDIVLFASHVSALSGLISGEIGQNLLAGYKRCDNVLAIENKKDGRKHEGLVDPALFTTDSERALFLAAERSAIVSHLVADEKFVEAAAELARLRQPIDEFFVHTTVNDEKPDLRSNRLNLLAMVIDLFDNLGYFTAIESYAT